MENKKAKKILCLILDDQNTPIARAVREKPQDAEHWQVRVLDGKARDVVSAGVVQIIGISNDNSSFIGKVTYQNEDRLVLEPLRDLGDKVRQDLRIPVIFKSFIYPVSGAWQGRYPITGIDLSCGGVSFFCSHALQKDEVVEIVLPMTKEPLVLKCRILRSTRTSVQDAYSYACDFLDLIDEEIKLVCESVFNIQIQNRADGIRKKRRECDKNAKH